MNTRIRVMRWVVVVTALAGCSLLNNSLALSAARRPNVILILADDVGQECLGCYGGESYRTPHLDQLASDGLQFKHCYSMPSCHPTRLTLLTGRYPFRFGNVRWGDFPVSAESETIASVLQQAGYATHVAGKWQLALLRDQPDHPQRLGFRHSDVFGWHEGPRYYNPLIYRDGSIRNDTQGFYGPDLYVRSIIDFMRTYREQPFFVYYSMALCHDVTDDLDAPVPHGPFGRYDNYAEMVEEMDRAVGRIVGALEALQLREDTLLLFVGDNGTPQRMILRADGDRLIRVPVASVRDGQTIPGGKKTLKDGGTSVPLIANWPGVIDHQQVTPDLVDMSDFLPTILELAEADAPANVTLDGHSFAGRLRDNGSTTRKVAFAQRGELVLEPADQPSGRVKDGCWVRTATWKLYQDGRLFDMHRDPLESSPYERDLDAPRIRTIRDELEEALAALIGEAAFPK